MPINRELMDNVKANRVKQISDLTTRKARKKSSQFLVEGPQAVREALRFATENVRDVYVRSNWREMKTVRELVNAALDADLYVHEMTEAVERAVSTDCQGIFAVLNAGELFDRDIVNDLAQGSLIAACWQLRDPGNAGTIIRAADASGCEAVILVGECVDVTNPKVVRSTTGSLFHVPVVYMSEEEFLEFTQVSGARVTAADVYGTQNTPVRTLSAALDDTDFEQMNVILFGNEARGLTAELVDVSDRAVAIPLYGNAESLNVAMSASIMLYAFAMKAHE